MPAPIPLVRLVPTGRSRGRPRFFFRSMILQIELRVERCNPSLGGAQVWVPVRTEWKDATWQWVGRIFNISEQGS